MRKSIFAGVLLLGAALLFTQEDIVQAKEIPGNGNIPLTAGYFPDEWFLKNVTRYDKNKDGYLSSEEVAAVTKLLCERDLTDFSQVQYFTNLRELTILTESEMDGYDLWVGDDIDLTVFPNLEDARLLLDSRKAPAGGSDIQIRVSGLEHLKSFQVRDRGSNGNQSYSGADAKIGVIDLRDTKELEMVSITDAKGVIFDSVNQIKWISLGNITGISNKMFEGFEKLEHLWIWSHASEFTQFYAAGLDALRELTLVNKYLQTAEISGPDALENVEIQSDVLGEIDMSQSPGLKRLKLECPKLKAVDLAAADTLESVTIKSDLLGQLDVEKNTALKSLDVSKLPKLRELKLIANEKLTKLDLSKNKRLSWLVVGGSKKLTALDLSNNKKLHTIDVKNNGLKKLKLGKKPYLESVYCQKNSLKELDFAGVDTDGIREVICDKKVKIKGYKGKVQRV